MKDIFEKQANICKTFANPKRLEIMKHLSDKKIPAGELLKKTGISKANLSQHMSKLIKEGVVLSQKKGLSVTYSLSDKRILQACALISEVLIEKLERENKVLLNLKGMKKK